MVSTQLQLRDDRVVRTKSIYDLTLSANPPGCRDPSSNTPRELLGSWEEGVDGGGVLGFIIM